MEILKIIYVALIEGMKSFVPVEAKQIEGTTYLIVNSKLFDPEDNSSLFEFIPGDIVSVKVEIRKGHEGVEEEVLVADSLIKSNAPNRNLYMLKFTIVNQNGNLSSAQLASYRKEIVELRDDILSKKEAHYHPGILRWAKE